MKEIWKNIIRYEGIYDVSNIGRIKRIASGRILKQCQRGKKNYKYLCVCLYKNGKKKIAQVHILMAEAFFGFHKNKIVRHLDGNRFNNSIANLSYGTQQQNIDDRSDHGNTIMGSKQWQAKLDENKVKEIRRLYFYKTMN